MNSLPLLASTYCRMYIVRHGQTEWNVAGIMQGHGDSPLTEMGISQAKDLGNKLTEIHFDAVFSSDSLRAVRTAELISLERNLIINTTELLRERSYGKFDGRPAREYSEENKHLFAEMQKLTDQEKLKFKLAPDMDSQEEVWLRYQTYLREIAVTYPNKTVLVVTHGGGMRSLLIHLGWGTLSELPGGSIDNTAYVILDSDGVNFFVRQAVGVRKTSPKSQD